MLRAGTFQALLDFRSDGGDTFLESRSTTASKIATYRPKATQNDVINCLVEFVKAKLNEKSRLSRFYSILDDDVADYSNKEQVPLVICYHNREGNIQERFMKFIHCTSGTSGKAPAMCMMTCITVDLGLDIKNVHVSMECHPRNNVF